MKALPTIIIAFIAIFFLMTLVINKQLIAETITVSSSAPIDINQKKETKSKEADRVKIKETKVSFKERLSKSGPELRFDMCGKFKNGYLYKGHIEVFNTSNSKRIQKIIINNNFESGHFDWDIESFEYYDHEVQLDDINFDGYLDLRILDNEGATGNNWYATYIYDPRLRKFRYHKALSTLSGVTIDKELKQIRTYWRGDLCWECREYFEMGKDNRLILKKLEWTERDRIKYKSGCYKFTGLPRDNTAVDLGNIFYDMDQSDFEKFIRKKVKILKKEELYGSLDGRARGVLGTSFQ
jgi:hypothetical protein